MLEIHSNHIRFAVSADGARFELGFPGEAALISGDRGLFRAIAGKGNRHEAAADAPILAARVETREDQLAVVYEGVSLGGATVPLAVQLTFRIIGDCLECRASLDNPGDITVEEFWFPLIGLFAGLSDDPSNDILIRPDGFGRRIPNPSAHLASLHTGYMAPDQVHILDCGFYPGGPMSMPWFGIYGQRASLSIFSLDSSFQTTGLLQVLDTPTGMMSAGIARYPFVETGRWDAPLSVVRLHRGDWHTDARFYRSWVDKAWWSQAPRPDWVNRMHGWQRIIMKHQYGEIFYRYEDLVDCFEAGRKYGIDALLVFGWFQGGHDNGYPEYFADEELGGEQALRDAIAEVRRRGGRILLYANGHIIDVDTDFYKTVGQRIALKTSQGSEYREHYKFSGDGTYLRHFGAKAFAAACQSTDEWREKLIEIGLRMADLGADSIFFDQMGGHVPYLCFDKSHPHPGPAFAQGPGKDRNMQEMRRRVVEPRPGLAFGTELVSDCLVRHADYVHTATYGMSPGPQTLPEVFLYTFPEIILSCREIRDERDHERRMHWAFTNGWIFDVEIWRCRGDLRDAPAYGEYMQRLIALRDRWPELLMTGRFTDQDSFEPGTDLLRIKGFESADGLAVVGWNDTGEHVPFAPEVDTGWVFEEGATPFATFKPGDSLPPQSIAVLVYRKGGK